jgi:hypothetical protein
MRPAAPARLLPLLLLLAAAAASGADGGNATVPLRRSLAWRGGADDGERLPGWQGEQARGGARKKRATKGEVYAREDRERGTWMELIAWRPRAYIIHNFMSPEECVALVKTAKPFMARSTVVDSVTGESKVDPIRTRRVPACRCQAGGSPLFCGPPAPLPRRLRAPPRGAPGHRAGGDALLWRHWATRPGGGSGWRGGASCAGGH